MLSLDRSDARGIDPAHLARTHTDGAIFAGVHDGIGFHVHGDVPGEQQVAQFLCIRDAFGNNLEIGQHQGVAVGILGEHAAGNALEIDRRTCLLGPFAGGEHTHVGFF